ncbi:sensor histidine kinase [Novilysobacter antarcticus]|uniref:sensor histidine kinase n=1 Tax=Novilysobacter antarcticus TaxID=2862543 RepID=UPI001C98EB6E|nr:HAMP domain-containing sensor histidine kinase [Lysobacter antarcticus]
MRFPLPLRTRVTLLYTVMGAVLSIAFALGVVFIAEEYERVLVESILTSQAHDYAERLQREPGIDLPRSARVSGYQLLPDNRGEVPDVYLSQPPGIGEVRNAEGDEVFLGVFDTSAGRLFFVMDVHDIEALERYLALVLAVVVLAGTALSAWLGWLLSGRVVRPVQQLAQAVTSLPIQPERTALADKLPADELGQLASAIDDYQARLASAAEAEQTFLGDASHELRTPISVVRGATELLLEDSADIPALQPRLQRLDRGIRELSELIDALMRLARRRVDSAEPVELRGWLVSCLAGVASIVDGTVSVALDGAEVDTTLPTRDATLIVHGVLRRLLPPGVPGTLRILISNRMMSFAFAADDTRPSTSSRPRPASSDRRLGLTLVGRLADRIGWEIDDSDAASGSVDVHFVKR